MKDAWNERSRLEGTPLQRYFEQYAKSREAQQRVQANDTLVVGGRRERDRSARTSAASTGTGGVLRELFRAHELAALARDTGTGRLVASEDERRQFPALFGRGSGESAAGVGHETDGDGDDEELLQLLAASDDEVERSGPDEYDDDGSAGRARPKASSIRTASGHKRQHNVRKSKRPSAHSSKRRRR